MSFIESFENLTNIKIYDVLFVFEKFKDYSFSWTLVGNNRIPYILHNDVKYCYGRMVEKVFLSHFWTKLNNSVFDCISIPSIIMNPKERTLFDQINFLFCEGIFGANLKTRRDVMLRSEDVQHLYEFLSFCEYYATSETVIFSDKCGYVCTKKLKVPYVNIDNVMYVPLFFLDKITDEVIVDIKGTDLWYLKFCCSVLGLCPGIYEADVCKSVRLFDFIKHFPQANFYLPDLTIRNKVLNTSQRKTVKFSF